MPLNVSQTADLTTMKRTLLKSKIHRATVTEADLNYEGSITIDPRLMKAADIVEFERVEAVTVTIRKFILPETDWVSVTVSLPR